MLLFLFVGVLQADSARDFDTVSGLGAKAETMLANILR